jgi:SAM-dependent methyltransferase
VSTVGEGDAPRPAASDDVRDFYEKLPYPPPVTHLDDRELYKNPQRRRALYHRIWPRGRPGGRQEILIAGCGTSQAARYAMREPDARVTAIDVSETSLRHTADLKRQYSLENLELHPLALENVQNLGRSFDLIVCTGVLHHLPDPDLGLCALRDVLNPQGAMQLMVYAAYGRAGIYMLQEYCRLLRIGTTAKDLRDLGSLLETVPKDHPLAQLLGRAKDFREPAAIADALLHPRDRAYTVPELCAWLERCGVSFGRWLEQAPYLPQCGALAHTGHGERLHALPPPVQHAAAELFRGTMTQHRLIAYGGPRARDEQTICFTSERWQAYVPIRLPWALCIRERLPAGSTAVLLNPVHQHRDLILPIDSAEDGLLGEIDGVRTLGEIVSGVETTQRARALQFFERLWQYDQIVFDASGTVAAVN